MLSSLFRKRLIITLSAPDVCGCRCIRSIPDPLNHLLDSSSAIFHASGFSVLISRAEFSQVFYILQGLGGFGPRIIDVCGF